MKIIPAFALLASASAFAPSSQTSNGASSMAAWKDDNTIGILPPAGFFDPFGFSNNKSDEVMNYYREAELKNGRGTS